MVTPALKLNSLFAVPFAETRLVPCERLNRELEALFLQRETAEHQNPTPSHISQAETFESRFNLFRWPEACVQELRNFMLNAVAQTVIETTSLKGEDIARLKFQNHTWFHISRYAGSFVAHNHPLASWSAVYCVRAGEKAPQHPDSGVLRFLDVRQGANAYLDPANATLRRAYALAPVELKLEAGQLVIFPSYVFHEVTPFYGSDTRITVATNCWFA
ncbi:MAG TPA: putative 2OG-Fe(II) oxygenase [Steroidobacteraceae bacterium]|nr:putative 2OG-Fe(II) oxygenase [Steroidobacteraceae bacterium]